MARRSPPIYPFDLPTLYAQQLRKRRQVAGLSMDTLAEVMGYTGTWIWQVENCQEKPSAKFAEDCDTYWQTDRLFRDIQEAIDRPGRPVPTVPGFDDYARLELQAAVVRDYAALLVTGVLQTEDYARAVCTSDQRTVAETEAMVRRRMDRQTAVFSRDDPPRLWAVHDERALRAPVAPPAVMRAQWKHLVEMAQRPRVHLQVVPANVGYYEGYDGSFTVLEFTRGALSVAYTESGFGHLTDEPGPVASYSERFELIRNVALTTTATIDLITSLMEGSP